MTERGKQLLGAMRINMQLLTELDKTAPDDVHEIVGAFVSHVRAWKPSLLGASLDTGPVAKLEPK